MKESQQRNAAKQFAADWEGKGNEKSDTQTFWNELLTKVFGATALKELIAYEKPVIVDGNQKYIDAYIRHDDVRVIVEQKSFGIDLNAKGYQSGGIMLTPYEQAKRYDDNLNKSDRADYIITCNFSEFVIYDMNHLQDASMHIMLEKLPEEYHYLNFLVGNKSERIKKEMEVSLQAGEMVGLLYDALHKQYVDPDSASALKSLNVLCVRLVFCLYAEDAGIFGQHNMFHDYLAEYDIRGMRRALIELFRVLDTPLDKRDPYLKDDNPRLASFPYVNGSLFADESIEIPPFTDEIRKLLLDKASCGFDWSQISPTIFGAVFESTLNPETRRSGGMHYTSLENIHKVIDPLFLDDLKQELAAIEEISAVKTKITRLHAYQDKLSSLTFLDPACGSGNFLTETYLSLRTLENEVIELLIEYEGKQISGQIVIGAKYNPIKVSISNFYGIEINDFAVSVAKAALWIAESQMMQKTEEIIHQELDFLPLTTNAYIVEKNALRIDWETVVPKDELNYIMGNPPFVGARIMSKEQKDDLLSVFGAKWKNAGNLDYVSCWYKKAADLMKGTAVRAALVSTNSITQGESVAVLWKPLFYAGGVHIDFAHRTFIWDSEARSKAHVHCVIVGFSVASSSKPKVIFTDGKPLLVKNINGYLIDGENVFVENRSAALCKSAPNARSGNKPIDDGNYLFTQEEMQEFIKKEPMSAKYFRPWIGSYEFINRKERYCLWLGNCPPSDLKKMPHCLERISRVRKFRLESKSAGTVKLADKPTHFHVETILKSTFLVMPLTSSQNRRYVPIGFLSPDYLPSNLVVVIENATLYDFGVITSNVFMAWMRTVCGRLKSDYRITKDNVYNNFPWCNPTPEQKAKIERTAQAILDARALYPNCSLADMYGEQMYLFPELLKAHQQNDRAVMQAYGFDVKHMTESECVAELMKMYQSLTEREKSGQK